MLPNRRRVLTSGLACVSSLAVGRTAMGASPSIRLATFSADVTPDRAIISAQSAVRTAVPMSIELPGDNPSYTVELEPQDFAPTDPRVIVVMDAKTGSIDYIDDPRNYAATDQVLNLQHNLHFGVGLGWIWMILVFLSGLMPLLFAITGLTVWWKRRRSSAADASGSLEALAPPAGE